MSDAFCKEFLRRLDFISNGLFSRILSNLQGHCKVKNVFFFIVKFDHYIIVYTIFHN